MDRNAHNAVVQAPPPAPAGQIHPAIPSSTTTSTGPDGTLFGQLTGNPLFTAGFGLAALAAAARFGQRGLKQGADLLRRRMLVDLEVTRHDESYQWLLRWMTNHQRQQAMNNSSEPPQSGLMNALLHRIQPRLHHLQIQTLTKNKSDGSAHTNFSLVPGHGRHILRYRNAFILVDRQREKAFDLGTGTPFETVTLTTLYSQRHIFEQLFQEAHALAKQMNEGKTVIYTGFGTEWRPFGTPKQKRPLASVVLAEGVKERIVTDLEKFLAARDWYMDRGIPYRRGYLLHGPPGTGKSSFIQALAGHLDFNIAMLNVAERGLTDDRLNHLLMKVPPRTLVLLEDADAAFANRRTADPDGYNGATVTFSGLLNALDGVASGEERVIFLTTNYPERLDDALIRPGRVDMAIRLGEASDWQVQQLWDRFYGDMDEGGEGKKTFMARAKELGIIDNVSTAALQGLFLYNKDDMRGAISMVDELRTRSVPQ